MIDMVRMNKMVENLDTRPPMGDEFYSLESLIAFDLVWDYDEGPAILAAVATQDNQ